MRCDSKTDYVYDFNIYSGKEVETVTGTLGERVVKKLMSTLGHHDVVIAMDRFFTSVDLLRNSDVALIGTVMKNRKNVPQFSGKLSRSASEYQPSSEGIMVARWMDSKEVVVLSNCHYPTTGKVKRRQKDGAKLEVSWHQM